MYLVKSFPDGTMIRNGTGNPVACPIPTRSGSGIS
jgi:hypothetical protein